MDPEIIYHVQPGPYWDWKVAVDLFLGGAGVGAFLFSVALSELWGRRYRRIPQTAAMLAPVLVGALRRYSGGDCQAKMGSAVLGVVSGDELQSPAQQARPTAGKGQA